MSRPNRVWYLLILALVALAPVGLRALSSFWSRRPAVDLAMAREGEVLFKHEWKPGDPLSPGGDGLGPVYNATSCVACHHQGGAGGGGELKHNVTAFTVRPANGGPAREGVVHAQAVRFQETLAQVHPQLPPIAQPSLDMLVPLNSMEGQRRPFRGELIKLPSGVNLTQTNTPALFGAGLIDAIPDWVIIAQERKQRLKWGLAPADNERLPVGRTHRVANGRVGKFGWKAQTASLAEFVQAACANELGLGNPGQAQPRPLGRPYYLAPGLDLTLEQCSQLTTYIESLPRPAERPPASPGSRNQAEAGKELFHRVGCAECHTPDLGSVEGIYSDLLLHRMGEKLVGNGSYGELPPPRPDHTPGGGPHPDEWRTPPLWGVADSAPYLHDGRAATLEEAIRLHAGQGERAAERFARLKPNQQAQLLAFLKTLRAP
jgi:CxxC motif-containing protein (DUF1111 family)